VVVWLGLVSYGLYLWNESLLDRFMEWTDRTAFNTSFATTFVAVAAMTAGVAALSYYLLERPVLRLKRAVPDRRPPVPVATD
jgi:peptidoglycan/LPS O-acetylase OafA/YrhL